MRSLAVLTSETRIEGLCRTTANVRPLRIAYLVDPSDPVIALNAVEAATLHWGGKFQFLIPCSPGGQPLSEWSRVLEKQDPDVIIDLIGTSESYRSFQKDEMDRAVIRWEQPANTMLLFGASVYSTLRRWGRTWRGDQARGERTVCVHFTPLAGDPHALPLAFRFGHIDPRPPEDGTRLHPSYQHIRHRRFLDITDVNPATLSEEQRVRLVTEVPLSLGEFTNLRSGINQFVTPIGLTVLGVPLREPSYRVNYSNAPRHPEDGQYDEAYLRRVLVVSDPSSVPDLCLAWNLRAQRSWSWMFPIWLAPKWLSDPNAIRSIDFALQLGLPGLSEDKPESPQLHLVSASMSPEELATLTATVKWSVNTHDKSALDRFFTSDLRTGISRDQLVVFSNRVARVELPDWSEMGEFDDFDRIGWTVLVDGYNVPRGSHREYHRLGANSRLASDGIAGTVSVYPGTERTLPIGTNDGWEIVSGTASRAGYTPSISDKGQLAIAVLGLLDDPMELSVLSSSKVYGLLREMAEIVPRQAIQSSLRRLGYDSSMQPVDEVVAALQTSGIGGGQFDRQHRNWDSIRRSLGISRQAAATVVNWLVANKILFRGYEIICPNCRIRRWYPIGRMSDTHRCDACQMESPTPVPPGELLWQYRLNELVARAVDQGALTHLIVARRLSSEVDLFGSLPGLLLEPSRENGPTAIEVDLLAVGTAKVIIGECKASGSELTSNDVDRYAELARRLKCSRIIYATTSDFSEVSATLERARTGSSPAWVEVWQQQDLFDGGIGEEQRARNSVDYLEGTAKALRLRHSHT